MRKHGDNRDIGRRRQHVSALQDEDDWVDKRVLPPADATWPTCLIIAPASVVRNWEREFEVVRLFVHSLYAVTIAEGIL
jgi:DNA excision repair protein ERCC-6-like 2